MNGKNKCRILKEIRKEIAKQNDIEFVTSECKFQGNCTGTCPKCEAEVRYLEQEIAKRRSAGKTVAVAGIAAAMLVSAAGCAPGRQEQTLPSFSQTEPTQEQNTDLFMGVPAEEDTQPTEVEVMGDIAYVSVPGEVPED